LTTFQQVPIEHERSLTSQLKAYAADRALNGPKRQSKSIHASSHYGCGRRTLYGLLGYEQTNPNYVWGWDLSAKHGEYIHQHVQNELIESGKILILPNGKPAVEVTLDGDILPKEVFEEFQSYKIGMRIDAIAKGPNKAEIPVEIKTVDHKYLAGSERKYLPDKLADYESQAQMYMHFWRNTETGERPTHGLLYVISRGDISLREEWVIEYNPLFVESALEHISMIRDHWLKAELMEPEISRKSCGFCNYLDHCPATLKDKQSGGFRG
jgi:CRISPR/Cas system-associated exonuclease Cas4 (RecB family)